MAIENLWGELPKGENIRTPHSLLLEQASLLSQLTEGLLVGIVARGTQGDQMSSTLQIRAPALGNYTVGVARVDHDMRVYPCNVYAIITGQYLGQAKDDDELRKMLGSILKKEEVRRIVSGLLAQIRADKK